MKEIKLVKGITTQGVLLHDNLVGDYIVTKEGNDPVLINNFESDEVVNITASDTINTLKRKGYVVQVGDVVAGTTKLLYRKNCVVHSVKPMEDLQQIASYYKVSTDSIVSNNNLKTTKLYIGQLLVIY